MEVEAKISLPRAEYPEQAGVSSRALADFMEDLQKSNIETHSIMIIRRGKVAFERWRKPYAPEIPHTMYSISKSVTATAAGFAVEEGLLALDAKVIDFFPEHRPMKRDEKLEKMTVYHLLTMTAGKDVGLMSDKAKNRWIEDFFNAKWMFAPGESWRYISENTFMLSAILKKVTGMDMADYLGPRLFEPLGINRKPFWEKNADGIEAGGWGIYLTTEECAKIMLCYAQGGVFNGKQVIPAKWAKDAVSKLVDNKRPRDVEEDTVAGYGYCFWRNGCPDSYRADGMFSQFAMVFEKLDAVFVMTSNEMDEDKARHCVWRHFPGVFIGDDAEPRAGAELLEQLELKPLPDLPAAPRAGLEKAIQGKTIRLKKHRFLDLIGFPVSVLPLPVLYMGVTKAGNIDKVRFEFGENECAMSWTEGVENNTIFCGMDGAARRSTVKLAGLELTAHSTAAWQDDKTLLVWTRPLEAICERRLTAFTFDGQKARMKPRTSPDARFMLEYVSRRITIYVNNKLLTKIGETLVKQSVKIIEPVHKGRFGETR